MDFCYARKYKNNKQLLLAENTSFIERLLDLNPDSIHAISAKQLPIFSEEFTFASWTSGITFKDNRIDSAYTKTLWENGYRDGVSVVQSNEHYEEVWAFIPLQHIENFDLFCIRNSEVFKRFIRYFNNKAADFLKVNTNKLNLLRYRTKFDYISQKQKLINEEQERIKKFIGEIGMIIKTKNGEVVSISPQEIKFLGLLSEGNNIKQIAKALNISPKTSENHMYNIRVKTGYTMKSNLIKLYLDQSR